MLGQQAGCLGQLARRQILELGQTEHLAVSH
jgi:hypothetical protein